MMLTSHGEVKGESKFPKMKKTNTVSPAKANTTCHSVNDSRGRLERWYFWDVDTITRKLHCQITFHLRLDIGSLILMFRNTQMFRHRGYVLSSMTSKKMTKS